MTARLLALLALVAVFGCAVSATARADGDPGSDVLAYQPSFVAPDARVSIRDQLQLSAILRAAAKHNAPIRVAIIAHRDDLGAITKLWNQPQAYASFSATNCRWGTRANCWS